MANTKSPSSSAVKDYADEDMDDKKSKPKGKKPIRKPMPKTKNSWHGF